MTKNLPVRRRLIVSFLVIGILNVLSVTFFFTYIHNLRRENLFERAESHLISVHSLTKAKIKLYLDNLKTEVIRVSRPSLTTSEVDDFESSLESVWKIENGKVAQLTGQNSLALPDIEGRRLGKFIPYGEDKFFIQVKSSQQIFVWLFNLNGLSSIIPQRQGMGETGEVYLVGPNKHLISISRFVEKWSTYTVENASVQKSFEGFSGVNAVKDYQNIPVLSAYGGIEYDELPYVLLAEIEIEEVLRPLNKISLELALFSLLLITVNLLVAYLLSRTINKKLKALSDEVQSLNKEKEKQSNESAIQVIRIQEDEREKISFTLHDSVGQYLTVLKWGLADLKFKAREEEKEAVENLLNTCDDIIHEIRGISHDLMPTLIKDFGCCLAIKDYFEKQKQLVTLKMNFTYAPNIEDLKFRKEFDINLYRMVQEFYQNTLKHSQAKSIDLDFLTVDNKFIIIYHDDGKGMPLDAKLPVSLSYRARLFGGEMVRLKYDTGLGFKVSFNLKDICA